MSYIIHPRLASSLSVPRTYSPFVLPDQATGILEGLLDGSLGEDIRSLVKRQVLVVALKIRVVRGMIPQVDEIEFTHTSLL